jgi:hypothetical protein
LLRRGRFICNEDLIRKNEKQRLYLTAEARSLFVYENARKPAEIDRLFGRITLGDYKRDKRIVCTVQSIMTDLSKKTAL